jgi:hypothetical protein
VVPWCFPGHHQWANGLYRCVGHEFSTQQKEQSPKELHGIASLVGFFFDHLKNAAKFSLTLLFLLDRVRIAYPSSSPRNKSMSIFLPFSHPPLRYLRLFSHQTHSGHYRGEGCICALFFFSFWAFFSGQGQSQSNMATGLPAPLPRTYPVQNQGMEKPSWTIYTPEGLRESEITAEFSRSASPRNGQHSPPRFNTAHMKP